MNVSGRVVHGWIDDRVFDWSRRVCGAKVSFESCEITASDKGYGSFDMQSVGSTAGLYLVPQNRSYSAQLSSRVEY